MILAEIRGAWDDFVAIGVLVCGVSMLICIGCVGLCLKLYTEFVKEKKYREP